MPHVLICQNNQNALKQLTSQLGHVLTEKKDAVICHIQQFLQEDAGVPRVMPVILTVCIDKSLLSFAFYKIHRSSVVPVTPSGHGSVRLVWTAGYKQCCKHKH